MFVSSGGGRGFIDDGEGGEKTSWRGGLEGVLLLPLNRAPNDAGDGSLPLPLALDTSGVITLYASREKKRTLCPVPGVWPSRRIERNELKRPSTVGVMGP